MTLFIYSIQIWFKRTNAAFAFIGIVIFAGIYFVAWQFDLVLTTAIFRGFFAVLLLAIIIIFQEEIKQFFERLARRSLQRAKRVKVVPERTSELPAILTRTLTDLAVNKVGALIVFEGRNPIDRHLHGCVELNGKVSESLLKSIFDPHSMGHDGAIIIEGENISRFGCHLPLSKNSDQLSRVGTRHAAAVGISELSDAFCLVVSEERGQISVVRNGQMTPLDQPEKVTAYIEDFLKETAPAAEAHIVKDFFKRNYREKIFAALFTILLWFLFVHESKLDYRNYLIPVETEQLPADLEIIRIRPENVAITVQGPRRLFYFVDKQDIKLSLLLYNSNEGVNSRPVLPTNFTLPDGITLENIEPEEVDILLGKVSNQSQQGAK
jgi:diadenylate cyclase